MAVLWMKPDPEDGVTDLAQEIIEEYHFNLRDARIAFVFRSEAIISGNLVTLGMAKKVGADMRVLAPYDFLIWLARPQYLANDEAYRRALIDHELCHCEIDEDGNAKMRGHDFEEFREIIDRHGFWRPHSDGFKRTVASAVQRQGLLEFMQNAELTFTMPPRGRVELLDPALMTG